jgi:hypothetical protein
VSYKDLLLVLDAEATARERVDFACAFAERFSAHLIGLYPLPTPGAPGISAITTRRCSILSSWNFRKGRAVRPSKCAKP